MRATVCKRIFYAPTMWSHTRSINVVNKGQTITYEIPMYMKEELEAKFISVFKSKAANTIVVEFYIDTIETDAPPVEAKVPELS